MKEEKRRQKLEESLVDAKMIPELESIFRVKDKIFAARKDRELTTEGIKQVKKDYPDIKIRVKGFAKEQIVNFHKSTVSKSVKASTVKANGKTTK